MAKNFAELPTPRKLLVVTPKYFDVQYVINPHMEGKVGTVDFAKAACQWDKLKLVYKDLGYEVCELEGQPGLLDMVYSANHAVSNPSGPSGGKEVFMSNMGTEQRREEVPHFQKW
jgi:N-dimethylarginine dimethylaminohydrolase